MAAMLGMLFGSSEPAEMPIIGINTAQSSGLAASASKQNEEKEKQRQDATEEKEERLRRKVAQIRTRPRRNLIEPMDKETPITDKAVLTACAFSPDGRYIAYGGSNKAVVIQDIYGTDTEKSCTILGVDKDDPTRKLDYPVIYTVFSADGAKLGMLFGEGDKIRIQVYDIHRNQSKISFKEAWGEEQGPIASTGELLQMAFSPDAKWLVHADKAEVKITRTRLEVNELDDWPVVHCENTKLIAVSPDGRFIAASNSEKVCLFRTPPMESLAESARCWCAPWSGGEATAEDSIAHATDKEEQHREHEAPTWDVQKSDAVHNPLEKAAEVKPGADIVCICFSPAVEGEATKFLATGSEKEIHLWAVPTIDDSDTDDKDNVLIHRYSHAQDVRSLCFSHSGTMLASLCADGALHVWDVATEAEMLEDNHDFLKQPLTKWYHYSRKAVTFSPDDSLLATVGGSNSVTMREMDTVERQLFSAHHKGKVLSVAYSPDGKFLATGGTDNCLKVFRCPDDTQAEDHNHELEQIVQVHQPRAEVRAIAFSSDGNFVATGATKGMMVWMCKSDPVIWHYYQDHTSPVTAVAFSMGNVNVVASGDMQGNVVLREVRKESPSNWKTLPAIIKVKHTVNALAFSSSGNHLATGSKAGLKVYHVQSGRLHSAFPDTTPPVVHVTSLAFSHGSTDGEFIVIGTEDERMPEADDQQTVESSSRMSTRSLFDIGTCASFMRAADDTEKASSLSSAKIVGRIVVFLTENFQRASPTRACASSIEMGRVSAVAFTPDNAFVAAASNNISGTEPTVYFFDKVRGQSDSRKKMVFSNPILSLAIPRVSDQPSIYRVAVGTDEGGLRVRTHAEAQKDLSAPLDHNGRSLCCAFSANGKYVATGGDDNSVWIQRVESGKHVVSKKRFKARGQVVRCCYSPSGDYLWIGDSSGYVTRMKILEDGSMDAEDVVEKMGLAMDVSNDKRDNELNIIAIAASTGLFACVQGKMLTVHELHKEAPVFEHEHDCEITACTFSSDGLRLSIGDVAGFVTTWTTPAVVLAAAWRDASFEACETPVSSLAYNPVLKLGSYWLAIGTYSGLFYVYDAHTGAPHKIIGHQLKYEYCTCDVTSVRIDTQHEGRYHYDGDGRTGELDISVSAFKRFASLSSEHGNAWRELPDSARHKDAWRFIAPKIAQAEAPGQEALQAPAAEAAMSQRKNNQYLPDDNDAIIAMAFSPNADYLAYTIVNGRLIVLDAAKGHDIGPIIALNFENDSPKCLAFSTVSEREGNSAVLAISAGGMSVWDIERLLYLGTPVEQLFAYVPDSIKGLEIIMDQVKKHKQLLFATPKNKKNNRTLIQEAVFHINIKLASQLVDQYPFCAVVLNKADTTFKIACDVASAEMLGILLSSVSNNVLQENPVLKPSQLEAVVKDLAFIFRKEDLTDVVRKFLNSQRLIHVGAGKLHKIPVRGLVMQTNRGFFRAIVRQLGSVGGAPSAYYQRSRSAYNEEVWAEAVEDVHGVVMRETQVPLPYLGTAQLIRELARLGNTATFENEVCEALLESIWEKYVEPVFYWEFLLYLVMLVCFMVYSLLLAAEDPNDDLEDLLDTGPGIALVAFKVPIMVLGSYHLYREWRQLAWVEFDLRQHFNSVFNILEPIGYSTLIIIPVLHLTRQGPVRELTAVASVIVLINCLNHMRAFATMGPLIRALVLIAGRMRDFIIILVVVVIGFSNAFYLLHYDNWYFSGKYPVGERRAVPSRGKVSSTSSLTFSETAIATLFSPEINLDLDDPLLCAIYVLNQFAVAIILLSMIIAMMSDIYHGIHEGFASEFKRERAGIIAELMGEIGEDTIRKNAKWIYVLKATEDSDREKQELVEMHKLRDETHRFAHEVSQLKLMVTQAV